MKIKTGFRDINNYDERVYNYGLSGTTGETPVRFFQNLSGPEKVASMVATFLSEPNHNN